MTEAEINESIRRARMQRVKSIVETRLIVELLDRLLATTAGDVTA